MSDEYSQGVMMDGAAILCNGVMITIDEIVSRLNAFATLQHELDAAKARNKILELKCAASLANNLCPDHRDKQLGKPCLACTIEHLESWQVVAVDALKFIDRGFSEGHIKGRHFIVPDPDAEQCELKHVADVVREVLASVPTQPKGA